MSHRATDWAVTVRGISALEARVLWHLADCHNPVLGCFPSQEYLAEAAEVDERSVRRVLGTLRDKGLVTWEETRTGNRRDNNRYRLACEADFEPDNLSGSDGVSTGQIAPSEPDSNGSLNRTPESAEPVIEPVREPERERARDPGSGPGQGAGQGGPLDQVGGRPGAAKAATLAALKRLHPGSAQEDPDTVAALWDGLSAAERKAAFERHGDWMEDGRKAGRKTVPKLAFYLGKRLWDGLPPPKLGGSQSAGEIMARTIAAFSRAWWWLFHEFVRRHGAEAGTRGTWAAQELGRRISGAIENAIGWSLDSVEAALAAEEGGARLVQLHRDSAEAAAWREHYAGIGGPPDAPAFRRGVRMPKPDGAPFIWAPSQWPPAPDGLSRDDIAAIEEMGR